MSKKILAIVTSKKTLDAGDPTGFWLEEFAAPYGVFREAGYEVDIASPDGGETQIDPASQGAPWLSDSGRSVLESQEVMAKIADTAKLADVDPDVYDAVFVVGGVGAAFDLHENAALKRLLEAFEAKEKVVSAICTGVVSLADICDANGDLLVAGKPLTAISNAENDELNITPLLPVLTETRLKEAGAVYEAAAPWGVCVRRHGRLITGQNPASAAPLGQAVVACLLS